MLMVVMNWAPLPRDVKPGAVESYTRKGPGPKSRAPGRGLAKVPPPRPPSCRYAGARRRRRAKAMAPAPATHITPPIAPSGALELPVRGNSVALTATVVVVV